MQNDVINTAFLLLGSNLGNRLDFLNQGIAKIDSPKIRIVDKSSVYETDAWGNTDQLPYLNQAIKVETTLDAPELLQTVLDIEISFGRERKTKWGSRTLDIDILYFNSDVIDTKELTVPHPFLQERNFALIPLCELDKNYVHPILGLSNLEMLNKSKDQLNVKNYH